METPDKDGILYELTGTQAKVYDFIRAFFKENDRLPPTRTIQKAFGWKSQTAAVRVVAYLARKGWLEAAPAGGWRLHRIENPQFEPVPSPKQGGLPPLPNTYKRKSWALAIVEPDDKGKSVPVEFRE